MHSAPVPTLVALAIQSILGLAVFQANPWRKPNQCFLLLSAVIGGWLACLYFSFSATTSAEVEFYIREASAAGALILTVFNLLRVSIQQQNRRWQEILSDAWIWLIAAIAVVIFCQTRFFLEGARFSRAPGASFLLPVPVYGRGAAFYFLYFVIAGLAVIINYARDVRQTTGGTRAELAFILTGAFVAIAATFLSFILGFFMERSWLVGAAPFRIVLFSLIVGYGVATRKIMEAGFFLRRAISYALLTAYLLALYALIWWLVDSAFEPLFGRSTRSAAHVTAAVVVAFAMASARGFSQSLADRLFISTRGLDFRTTINQAVAILKSVTTLRDLLTRFGETIAQAVDTDRVIILLPQKDVYAQRYPPPTPASRIDLPKNHALLRFLQSSGQPIIIDELHRARSTPESDRVGKHMQHLNLAVVMGIFAREQLAGVMLLGPRLSGRIYGSAEQEALQALCGQLAVAIENAELFTEVQNAKIYNETLLENLTTGVIAAGNDERITVFNSEAVQLAGLNSREIINHSIDKLPPALRDALRRTLQTGESQENNEIVLHVGDQGAVVRASTSIFRGEEQQVLGALMVLTDLTPLKRLELLVRRSDRLASLGTLSAGMAHEIKNPLVSIKTFAQLLPQRYQDSDFREAFSKLIGHEIERIDSLVNQLLRFARPTKPDLKPTHVHEVLEKSLQLIGHRLYDQDIKLARFLEANVDTISADADQLEQVFLNFFINAMEAMKHGGELTVSTQTHTGEEWVAPIAHGNGEAREVLRITIRDTGEGIQSEDIQHLFDPFFTTKDYGTGLGLSVVHAIIQEHGGQIEVESELEKGTAFHILLPLAPFASEVAAA
jgi:PAS domain S-box-containing protein